MCRTQFPRTLSSGCRGSNGLNSRTSASGRKAILAEHMQLGLPPNHRFNTDASPIGSAPVKRVECNTLKRRAKMDKKIIKEIERFKALSDSGEIFTIVVTQEFIIAEEFQSSPHVIPGLKSAQTTNGHFLNHKNDNQFEIVATGEILTKL